MPIVKAIFAFLTGLYAASKMVDGMNNRISTNAGKIVNLIEIVVSISLTFEILKF